MLWPTPPLGIEDPHCPQQREPNCSPWLKSPPLLAWPRHQPHFFPRMCTPAPGTLGHLQYLTPAWHHPWFRAPQPPMPHILANSSPPLGLSWHVASPACHCPVCSGRGFTLLSCPQSPTEPVLQTFTASALLAHPSLLSWPENQWRSWHVVSIRQATQKDEGVPRCTDE